MGKKSKSKAKNKKANKAAGAAAAAGGAAAAASGKGKGKSGAGAADAAAGPCAPVGFDIGYSAATVGVWPTAPEGRPQVIANEQGNRATPCLMTLTYEGDLIGEAAAAVVHRHHKTTVLLKDARKLLGATSVAEAGDAADGPGELVDMTAEAGSGGGGGGDGAAAGAGAGAPSDAEARAAARAAADTSALGFKFTLEAPVEWDDEGEEIPGPPPRVRIVTPEEAFAAIVSKLRETAEAFLGSKVTRGVVTIPASFTAAQREATRLACVRAGVMPTAIVHDSAAVALAHGLDAVEEASVRKVVVFDMGGTSVDVTVLAVSGGVIRTLAAACDNGLGGQSFDQRLVEHCLREFSRKAAGLKVDSKRSLTRLAAACEEAKRTLTRGVRAAIAVDSLQDGMDLNTTVSRQRFEDLCSDLYTRACAAIDKVLGAAGVDRDDVTDVLMAGGASVMPRLQRVVGDMFRDAVGTPAGGGASIVRTDVEPFEAVALGATIQAAVMEGVAWPKDAPGMGAKGEAHVTPTGTAAATGVASLSQHAISVRTSDGMATVVLPAGTPLPCKARARVGATLLSQRVCELRVLEGAGEVAAQNRVLGSLVFAAPKQSSLAGEAAAAAAAAAAEEDGDEDAMSSLSSASGVQHVASFAMDEDGALRVEVRSESAAADDAPLAVLEVPAPERGSGSGSGAGAAGAAVPGEGAAAAGSAAAAEKVREYLAFANVVEASLAGLHARVADGYVLEPEMRGPVSEALKDARAWLAEHAAPDAKVSPGDAVAAGAAGAGLAVTAAEAEEALDAFIDAVEAVACPESDGDDDGGDDDEGEEDAVVAPAPTPTAGDLD